MARSKCCKTKDMCLGFYLLVGGWEYRLRLSQFLSVVLACLCSGQLYVHRQRPDISSRLCACGHSGVK